MTYLLDTHIVYRALIEPKKLSSKVAGILTNTINECLVSAISFWKISLKYSLGKFFLKHIEPSEISEKCVDMGFTLIVISCRDASTYNQLINEFHKGPFDRMLIRQAIQNNYTLISDDKAVH